MFERLKYLPLYSLLLAAYPVLALYANNAGEVSANVLPRPLFVAVGLALVLLLTARLALRSWHTAAVLVALFLLACFSYGQVYELKKSLPALTTLLRHRYLFPAFILAFLAALIALLRARPGPRFTAAMNLVTTILVVMPLVSVGVHVASASHENRQAGQSALPARALTAQHDRPLPSVYFILLDTYMRSDALQRDLDYDNTAFVQSLQELGFYVPTCSRSNYTYTQASMVSALNMDYMDALAQQIAQAGLDMGVYALIKHSAVRQQLESLGYRTVAFDSGYEWSRIHDADAYLGLNRDTFAMQSFSRFEAMLIKSTALRVYTDYAIRQSQTGLAQANSPFNEHIELERFILTRLPDLAADPTPKFVFAHILIPHWPYVFLPDGSIRSDPDFDQDNLSPEQLRQGYVDSVGFVDNQLMPLLKRIIAESVAPPVIVLFGDHGLKDDNRLQNFAAFYLPGGVDALYPTITPVNYYRIIFNQVFAAGYPLLPDLSYVDVDPTDRVDLRVFPETAAHCLP